MLVGRARFLFASRSRKLGVEVKHFIVEQNFLAQNFVALANRSTRQLLDRRKGGEIRSGRLPRDELNTKSYVCSGPETPE